MQKKKNKINKIILFQVLITILGLIIIVAITVPLTNKVALKQHRINKEIIELQNEADRLEGTEKELRETIEYLESNQFTIDQARVNLNLKNKDEEVVVIKSNKNYKEEKTDINRYEINKEKVIIRKDNNLDKWWKYFFNGA